MIGQLPIGGWTFAAAWDDLAERNPDRMALHHEGRSSSWATLSRRAHALAQAMNDEVGLRRGDRIALGLPNRPEYVEVFYALGTAGGVHINTNHRYGVDELIALWDDMGVATVVFDQILAERIDVIRHRRPKIRWIAVDVPSAAGWSFDYEQLIGSGTGDWMPPSTSTGDDWVIVCTGGTTGSPKGVVWRQDDLFRALRYRAFGPGTVALPDAFDLRLFRSLTAGEGVIALPAAPLMHATGFVNALAALMSGGAVVTVAGGFDPARLLDAVQLHSVNLIAMVGNAFGRPLLDAIEREPSRWKLTSLHRIISAGMAWTPDVKRGLLQHLPQLELIDALGATEAIGMASNVTTAGSISEGAEADGNDLFTLSASAVVLGDDGPVRPGDGASTGRVAMRGHVPLGYLDDADRSAVVFPVVGGQRCAAPGDMVEVQADGRVRLLGRGSACINTGGEKVFAEEVEVVMLMFPGVHDVAVVGLADDRLGQQVVALVETDESVDHDELRAWIHGRLAGYKVPRRVATVATLRRAANGKIDRTAVIEMARILLADPA